MNKLNESNTMKEQAIQAQANRKNDTASSQQTTARPNGASVAPPDYGIDWANWYSENA